MASSSIINLNGIKLGRATNFMEKLEGVIQLHVRFQTALHDIVENTALSPVDLAKLSYDKVQEILSWYKKISDRSYIEKEQQSKVFVEKWLRNDMIPVARKAEALMLTSKQDCQHGICLNDHKHTILDVLSATNMNAFVILVVEERIDIDLRDMNRLDVMFAHVLSERYLPQCKASFVDCDDDDDEPQRFSMNKWEALVVNCCKVFHDQLCDTTITRLLYNFVRVSDPRMFHMPLRLKCFEGDFLPMLWKYYEERDSMITPIVKYRRNVGVIVNDDMCKCYTYNSFNKQSSVTLANRLSIEMPYMCYAYVDKIEVDFELASYEESPSLHLWNQGTEYIPCKPIILAETECKSVDHNDICNIVTLTATKEVKMPASYVIARFGEVGEVRYVYVKSVRLYGSAISFV